MRRGRQRFSGTTLLVAALASAAGFPSPAGSHEPPSLPGGYIYENWQREHGLPQVSVNALAQDHDGYLWIGTEEGLVRFDGTSFTVFNRGNTPELRSHSIRALLVDRHGRLWIATRNSLSSLENGRFALFTPAAGLPHPEVRTLYEDRRGALWIGTSGGLCRFDGRTFTSWTSADGLASDVVSAIHEDPEGVLWIGTEQGLRRFEEGRFSPGTKTEDLDGVQVRTLLSDRHGNLLIGTERGLFHLGEGGLAADPSQADRAYPMVNVLLEGRKGNLWIGMERGLTELTSGRETPPVILPENRVSALLEDREGSLWIGTGSVGLLSLRRSQVAVLGTPEGLADDLVWTIYQDRAGSVWIGTNNGLTHLAGGKTLTNYTTGDGLPEPDVRSLLEDRHGDLWIGTHGGGLARFRDGSFETFTREDGLADLQVNVLAEDGRGVLWIGTEAGLNRIAEGEWTTFTTEDGLPHESVKTLAVDPRGGLWIGTEAGLARYEGDSFTPYRLAEEGPEPFVKTLYLDPEGALWIGTAEEGLYRLDGGRRHRFTVEDGLYDRQVHQILEDGAGRLWMSSNQGIFHVAKKELDDFAAGRTPAVYSTSYTENDGMRSRECNGLGRPAGWKTRDGRLWFPTLQGVAILDPDKVEINEVAPPVQIEEVLIDHRPVDLGAGQLVIAPGAREFEFRYVGLSFIQPEKVRYRYKLEGFNEDWIDAGARRSAHYTNLGPGDYTFRIAAANSDGVWNEVGASFGFRLRPAFHQTWYFYAGLAVLLAWAGRSVHHLAVQGLVRRNDELYRMKTELEAKNAEIAASKAQAEAKANELERFTYTVSHDLKSPLFTVEGFLGMLRKDVKEGRIDRVEEDFRQIRDATGKMGQLLEDLLELSRIGRVVDAPQDVSVEELFHEATSLVAGKIAERGVEVSVASDGSGVRGDRRRLLEVCQNLIENAVKYMGSQEAPRIEVEAEGRGGEVLCSVSDNGMGIDPRFHERIFGLFDKLDAASEGSGIGLALVQRIIEVHGGRIWVESAGSGQGSTFFFTLPSSEPGAT